MGNLENWEKRIGLAVVVVEQAEGVKQTARVSRRSFLRGVTAAGLAIAGLEGVKPVSADTPIPTPDANAIKIADLETRIAENERKEAQETKIAGLEKKLQTPTPTATKSATPIPTAPAESSKTPTPTSTLTPTPDRVAAAKYMKDVREDAKEIANRQTAATVEPIQTAAEASAQKRIADVKGTAQAEIDKLKAEVEAQKSATPTSTPTGTPGGAGSGSGGSNEGGIPPFGLAGLGAVSLAGLVAYWGYKRGKRKNPPPPPPQQPPPPGIGGALGGAPSNPNTAPSTGPTQQKNPEWITGQQEFEKRWQAAKSKLSPIQSGDSGNEQGYVLDRFKVGMGIVHEVSLDSAIKIPNPMATRVRVGIECLIPEIWPEDRIFKRFFDPKFNAGFLTPDDLGKTLFLPDSYRNLSSFTRDQRRDVMRIRRVLLHALHPDLSKSDADPKLKDSIDILLRQLNTTWPLVNKLIS